MARQEFDRQLENLRTAVVELGDTVVERLESAATALDSGEESLARRVVVGDDAIDERYLEIERDCIDLFALQQPALQQPVASDLRAVVAAYKIATDLERAGDLAVNLAEYALDLERDLHPGIDLADQTGAAVRMVEDAVEIYAEAGDTWRCHELADRDTELDAMCAHAGAVVTRALLEHETTGTADVERTVGDVTMLMLAVRDLERVGDHAVNIAARTLYMTEGDDSLLE